MKWKWLVKIWMMLISPYIIFIEVFVYSNSLIQGKRRTLTWFISCNYSNRIEFIFNKILRVNCWGWGEKGWPVFIKCPDFYSWDFAILPVMFICICFPPDFYKLLHRPKPKKSLILKGPGMSAEDKSGILILPCLLVQVLSYN